MVALTQGTEADLRVVDAQSKFGMGKRRMGRSPEFTGLSACTGRESLGVCAVTSAGRQVLTLFDSHH